ncbi:hypothetical protein HDV00_000408 [Rhizophlyctis rosea]|nr:hypothetical protein HDV00_000408 [Rhizophlyctis rosea]
MTRRRSPTRCATQEDQPCARDCDSQPKSPPSTVSIPDILAYIFSNLSVPTTLTCEQVCSAWLKLIRSTHVTKIWKAKLRQAFPSDCLPTLQGHETWRDVGCLWYAWSVPSRFRLLKERSVEGKLKADEYLLRRDKSSIRDVTDAFGCHDWIERNEPQAAHASGKVVIKHYRKERENRGYTVFEVFAGDHAPHRHLDSTIKEQPLDENLIPDHIRKALAPTARISPLFINTTMSHNMYGISSNEDIIWQALCNNRTLFGSEKRRKRNANCGHEWHQIIHVLPLHKPSTRFEIDTHQPRNVCFNANVLIYHIMNRTNGQTPRSDDIHLVRLNQRQSKPFASIHLPQTAQLFGVSRLKLTRFHLIVMCEQLIDEDTSLCMVYSIPHLTHLYTFTGGYQYIPHPGDHFLAFREPAPHPNNTTMFDPIRGTWETFVAPTPFVVAGRRFKLGEGCFFSVVEYEVGKDGERIGQLGVRRVYWKWTKYAFGDHGLRIGSNTGNKGDSKETPALKRKWGQKFFSKIICTRA